MEDMLRMALREARERAAKGSYREVVFAHVIVPVLREWIDRQPTPEATVGAPYILGQLAARAGMPARRLYGLLHGEDVSLDLDKADRLMLAIDQHLVMLPEEGIVSTLEASVYARWEKDQIKAWYTSTGEEWPKNTRKMMPGLRRRYHAAHAGSTRTEGMTNALVEHGGRPEQGAGREPQAGGRPAALQH